MQIVLFIVRQNESVLFVLYKTKQHFYVAGGVLPKTFFLLSQSKGKKYEVSEIKKNMIMDRARLNVRVKKFQSCLRS